MNSNFNVNDTIIYGTHGICRIAEIAEKDLTGVKKTYYVLHPVGSGNSTYFVPTDSETLVAKMRKILSEAEINELIDSMAAETADWIENDVDRKAHYARVIAKGDPVELIRVIKAIFLEKKAREAVGKRLHAADEHFLKDAEDLLYSEFRYVLKLNENQLMTYIFERIEK